MVRILTKEYYNWANAPKMKGYISDNITSGLMCYYKFDEPTGNPVDSTGLTSATNNGCTQNQTGKIDKCFHYNGSSNYVTLGDVSFTDNLKTMSISFWINFDAIIEGNENWIIAKDASTGGRPFSFGYYFSGANKYFNLQVNGVGNGTWNYLNTSLIGSWHHIVVTFNDNTNLSEVYIDGVSQGTKSATNSMPATSTAGLNIGRREYNGANGYTYASIDEVCIWNRIISSNEVLRIFNSNNGLSYPFTN